MVYTNTMPLNPLPNFQDNFTAIHNDLYLQRTAFPKPKPKPKLKLPPISAAKGSLVHNECTPRKQQQQRQEIVVPVASLSLPRLDSKREYSAQNKTMKTSSDIPLALPRVYTVLPPIGSKTSRLLAPNDARLSDDQRDEPQSDKLKRTDHKSPNSRVRKVPIAHQADDSTGNIQEISNDAISIQISDGCLLKDNEIAEDVVNEEQEEDQFEAGDISPAHLYSEYSPHIPRKYQCYEDLYPPSPLPVDRRARQLAESKREEIRRENKQRMLYVRNHGHQRRNATCPELDDMLTQAPVLLREVFLRKTMEELCMLW